MAAVALKLGIVGCGRAARIHLARLLAAPIDGVRLVGCADPDPAAAQALAAQALAASGVAPPCFADHRELIAVTAPEAVAIFTPHRAHYRPAMDALQAGCHVFIEKPLSTNSQEAVDIIGLARGRERKVGIGHQYRLCPSLVEARRRLAEGAIGALKLVTATLAQPWLAAHSGPEDSWRLDPKVSGGGILADAGDHLIDALLWTTDRAAVEVAAVQERSETGLDLVTTAAIRLTGGVPAGLAITGVSPGPVFELTFHGDEGRLRATDRDLVDEQGQSLALPPSAESIDANFVHAVLRDEPLCCPADSALETVRLLEAIARSAATGQVARLS
jgi:predicted dehydrogenase